MQQATLTRSQPQTCVGDEAKVDEYLVNLHVCRDSVRVNLHHGVGSLDINPVVDPHDVVPRLGGVSLPIPPAAHRLVQVGAVGDGEPHCLQVVDCPASADWRSDQNLTRINVELWDLLFTSTTSTTPTSSPSKDKLRHWEFR